jgi:hypothetical protein
MAEIALKRLPRQQERVLEELGPVRVDIGDLGADIGMQPAIIRRLEHGERNSTGEVLLFAGRAGRRAGRRRPRISRRGGPMPNAGSAEGHRDNERGAEGSRPRRRKWMLVERPVRMIPSQQRHRPPFSRDRRGYGGYRASRSVH